MVCEFKKNQYTDLNKFSSNSISSLIIILFILDLRKNHFWLICISEGRNKFIFLILYVNDKLFITNNFLNVIFIIKTCSGIIIECCIRNKYSGKKKYILSL
jgi:hypothetical protein